PARGPRFAAKADRSLECNAARPGGSNRAEIVLTSRRILGEPWFRPRGGRGAVGGWQYAPGSSEAPNLEQGSEHDEISDHRGDGGVACCIGRSGARRRLQRSNKND